MMKKMKKSYVSCLLAATLIISSLLSFVGCDSINVSFDTPTTPSVQTSGTDAPSTLPPETTPSTSVGSTESSGSETTGVATVKPSDSSVPGQITIADVLAGELGKYEVKGTVVGYNAQSFLISDGTGMILVYKGNTWIPDVNAGYSVTVSGDTTVYGGAKQFGTSTTYTVTSTDTSGYKYPEPVALTASQIDAYSTAEVVTPLFVKVRGTLQLSGNYCNILIDGATMIGSISYPVEDFKNVLATLDGQTVDVTGYVTNSTGGGQFLSILTATVSIIKEDQPSTPAAMTIGNVIAGELGLYDVSGHVVGVNAQSFLISDGTGTILVYKGKTWTPDVKVGDLVTVSGETTVYGAAKQFGTACTYKVTGSAAFKLPSPKVLTVEDINAYASNSNIVPEYVTVVGVLSASGSYYNLAIDSAVLTGSVTYPTDDQKATLAMLEGKTIAVTGYVTGVTGGGKFLNILAMNMTLYK